VSRPRLDLWAIEASLREVQRDFMRINASLATPRDQLSDWVLDNLLAGYAYLDSLLEQEINPLARGNSGHLLKLNLLVLHGACVTSRGDECARQREATERRFYDDANLGGIRAFMNYLADHKDDGTWRLAAGAYMQVLSEPQMFIEGNHRTGALIASALLCRHGRPPFVLTVENAKAYFDPSSLVKSCRKRSLKALVEMPKLRKRLAHLLEDQADRRFLAGRAARPAMVAARAAGM
jgi:hypothetical protein